MNLLSVSNLKKEYDGETLFDGVSFSVESGEKIGLVGVNGAGKTTLFKLLVGIERPDGGEIYKVKDLNIGYLSQHALLNSEKCLYDEIEEVFEEVKKIEKDINALTEKISKGQNLDELIEKQAELIRQFEDMNGYSYKSLATGTLIGLGFTEEDFYRPVNTLSGGQRTRVCLAKLLLSKCNLLLLDEPTNHLDTSSVVWLESFVKTMQCAVIVVSHDRYFLDRVAERIFDMELGRLSVYKGNYTKFVTQKEIILKTQERNYENTLKEIKRLEESAELLHSFNREKSVKRAESKEKQIEKLSKTLVKTETVKNDMKYDFSPTETGGKEVVVMEKVSKAFGEKVILDEVDFTLLRGEKAFILGDNGSGKTTFLKAVLGKEIVNGKRTLGYRVTPAYYEQTLSELHPEKTVLDEVWDDYPKLSDTEIRCALAGFLFRGEEVYKIVDNLSGGEKARIAILKILLKKANFLVLDEPTNHLDMASREALEKALLGYTGTLLCVSHDRYFINKLATAVYETANGKVVKAGNSYEDYLSNKKSVFVNKEITSGKADYKSKKEYESQKRKAETTVKNIETEISKKESDLETLNAKLYGGNLEYGDMIELSKKAEEIQAQIEKLLEKWESASNDLEHFT